MKKKGFTRTPTDTAPSTESGRTPFVTPTSVGVTSQKRGGFTHTPTNVGVTLRSKGGFTIIELLVVVAIIGLLSSVVLVFLNSARENGRDARRMSDMRELTKALNLYYTNHNNFPVAAEAVELDGEDSVSVALIADELLPAGVSDPQHPGTVYEYESNASGSTYTVSFCLETDTITGYAEGCGNTITP